MRELREKIREASANPDRTVMVVGEPGTKRVSTAGRAGVRVWVRARVRIGVQVGLGSGSGLGLGFESGLGLV